MSQAQQTDGKKAERGYLMLLVGDERATSDAALGIGLRGAGHHLRVHIIEFLKTGRERGEVVATSFLTGVSLSQYGELEPEQTLAEVNGPGTTPERAEEAIREARKHVRQRVTNILILDGLLSVLEAGIVEESVMLDLVQEAAPWLDIVVTGRAASETLKNAADSVTVMETVKNDTRDTKALRRGLHY